MMWGDKRYHSLNYELKKTFGQKIMKLSLDGGFTCPNRDGTVGTRGCIFCGEAGAGEFTASRRFSIAKQMDIQRSLLSSKWSNGKCIAYFQNFTNTYSAFDDLNKKYNEALSGKDIVGLAIATRPDCLPEYVLDLLEEINSKTFLWVELGLQTIHDKTARFIRRGYELECYQKSIYELRKRNIRVVTHLIFGLPGESYEDILNSVKFIANTDTWGVKFHLLYLQKDTDIHRYYIEHPFHILTQEEYISLVADSIEHIPPEMVIHRLTGDGKRSLLVAPRWSLDKLRVLSDIDMELKKRDSYQGIKYLCKE